MIMPLVSPTSPFSHPVSFLPELTVPFHENVREKNALSSRGWSVVRRFFLLF